MSSGRMTTPFPNLLFDSFKAPFVSRVCAEKKNWTCVSEISNVALNMIMKYSIY